MEHTILAESRRGTPDAAIAQHLTAQGYRSPMGAEVLPSTVRNIRLKHRILQNAISRTPAASPAISPCPNSPKRWAVHLTGSTTASTMAPSRCTKHPQRKTFLFPDTPTTLDQFRHLKDGTLTTLAYGREYQDA